MADQLAGQLASQLASLPTRKEGPPSEGPGLGRPAGLVAQKKIAKNWPLEGFSTALVSTIEFLTKNYTLGYPRNIF